MIPGVKRPCLDCGVLTDHGSRCAEHDAAMRRRMNAARPSRPGYERAHQRVRATRGAAREYQCVQCHGPASEWALRAGAVSGQPWAYSDDPGDYVPMCRPCHRAHDAETRRARG